MIAQLSKALGAHILVYTCIAGELGSPVIKTLAVEAQTNISVNP